MENSTIADLRNTFADVQSPMAKSIKNEPKPASVLALCPRCFQLEQKRAARLAKKRPYKAVITYKDVLIDWR